MKLKYGSLIILAGCVGILISQVSLLINASRVPIEQVVTYSAKPIELTEPNDHRIVSTRVIDGDTDELVIDLGFNITITQSVRIYGVDTPEKSTQAGKLVKQVKEKWIDEKTPLGLRLKYIKPDKFANRFDGDIIADEPVSEFLLRNKLAKPYHGEKKSEWTARELSDIVVKCKKLLGD